MDAGPLISKAQIKSLSPRCPEDFVPSFYSLFLALDIDHVGKKGDPHSLSRPAEPWALLTQTEEQYQIGSDSNARHFSGWFEVELTSSTQTNRRTRYTSPRKNLKSLSFAFIYQHDIRTRILINPGRCLCFVTPITCNRRLMYWYSMKLLLGEFAM